MKKLQLICICIGGVERDPFEAFKYLSKAEVETYRKILKRDPFAKSLLPNIQKILNEARKILEDEISD